MIKKKHACPHCHQLVFTTWQKSNARDNRPISCSQCGKLSYCSFWAHASIIFSHEVVFWSVIVIAVSLKSWWALLLYPATISALFVLNYHFFPLKPITEEQVAKAIKQMWYSLGILLVVIVIIVSSKAWIDEY